MSPKQKAEELINKFKKDFDFFHQCERGNTQFSTGKLEYKNQKTCVHIIVDEILDLDNFSSEGRAYWQDVKTELEKL